MRRRKKRSELIGKKSIYDPSLHPGIAEAACRRHGLKNNQLAELFGISEDTLYAWYKRYPEFKDAARIGRDEFDVNHVENSLLRRALGYEYEEITTKQIKIKSKDEEYMPAEEIYRTKKEVVPDVKACMFWLQNRNPERWRNTKYINVDSRKTMVHQHTHKLQEEQLKAMEKDELRVLKKLVTASSSDDRADSGREESNRLH